MAITLVTGPANAGKARALLDGVRADAAREREPLLIVPTHADVESYRRELAAGGVVWGVRVERFQGLLSEIVRRAGLSLRPLTPLLRERVLAAVAARKSDTPQLAARPGFVRALARLVAELEVERVTPQRLRSALAAWADAEGGAGRDRRGAELGAIFAAYHDLLHELGRSDPDQRIVLALDALRRSPALWGATPVHLYGFDDLTRLQLDTIETLGRIADAPLTISLAYEAGRVAFAGRAGAFQTLLPWASEHRVLAARAEYYAPRARAALHRLERGLFEPVEGGGERVEAGGERLDLGQTLRLLEGGSPRAELELVAGEIRALLDEGMAPHEIALVHRSPHTVADLLAEVLQEFVVPFELPLRLPFCHTSLGHALCGVLAAALEGQPGVSGGGRLEDLLAWLRAPGLVERPELADRLEADARVRGISSAAAARALWESEHWPLDTLDHLREAALRGPLALIERTQRELQWLFSAAHREQAHVLTGPQLDDARALTACMSLLAELADSARSAPRLAPNPGELLALLHELELPGESLDGDVIAVLDPLALRARRVRALFLCGLQTNVFPAPAHPSPWLSEEERRGLAEASGLRLPLPDSALNAERYLFYAAISRPEELLALSWHNATDDGDCAFPSLFLEDVCDLFSEDPRRWRRTRAASSAHWPGPGPAPASWRERELALASPAHEPPLLQPLQDQQLLAELRQDRLWSASQLKNWMGCPARWFLESLLRARDIDPDAEPLVRGGLAHAVLKDTLAGLRRDTGSARLTPTHLPQARALLHAALAEHAPRFPLSVSPERIPGVRRRLEADLERYLECACEQDSALEPTYFELGFGFVEEPDSLPPLDLGHGVRVRGRIDRIDLTSLGQAVVYDYKGTHAPPPDKWLAEGHLQVALYMRAAEQLLHHETIGGFYQPLAGRDLRARGVLAADTGLALDCVRGDTRASEDLQELLEETLALAVQAAQQADAGLLEARPGTCAFGDGHCLYPSICRCES
ncbi:MAG TPA: PD-(D/E)XK nuclease family protein [Solirubrobacteraceae bacterium]|jgi:ATP-dependent helicase/DNAse subunit B|nr:PD-(D/E)XK nuclease family protein [Solirubrobacteraceae bacterium]